MNTQHGVTIVGGGPAGLAAAIALGRREIPVTVLDRQALPADKVCGEGVMPPGLRFLEEVGAAALISAADKYPFAGIRYHTQSGAQVQAEFEEGPGRGIRRTALSQALREVAAEFPSVTIHEGIRVTGLGRAGGLMELTCEGAAPITSRLVVGADGLRSRVRRWSGLEGRPTRRPRFGVRQHFRGAPWTRFVEVHPSCGSEAYVTPCGPDCIGVAILWEPKRCPHAESGERLYSSLLEGIPALHERLAGLRALNNTRSTGPFEQRTSRRIADGVALLGDASGYLDPCTGEGLTLAFKQAVALADCVAPLLQDPSGDALPTGALRPYERDWRRITRSYFLCTRFMLFSQRHPALFDRMVRLASGRPDLVRHYLSFNMGTAPFLPGLRRAARWLFPPETPHAENS